MGAIGGVVSFKADGAQYSTTGEFTVNIMSEQRTSVTDTTGEVHFASERVPSTISGTILTTAELDEQSVLDMSNATITLSLKNGKSVVLSNAFYSGDGSIDAKAGTMDIEFSGTGKIIK